MLWLINNLLEDTALLMKLADAANNYVQIRNEADEPYGEAAVDNTVVKLMEMGLKKFGPTFNFTVGRETAENLLFLCQRYFTELLENVEMPAYLIGMGHDGQGEWGMAWANVVIVLHLDSSNFSTQWKSA